MNTNCGYFSENHMLFCFACTPGFCGNTWVGYLLRPPEHILDIADIVGNRNGNKAMRITVTAWRLRITIVVVDYCWKDISLHVVSSPSAFVCGISVVNLQFGSVSANGIDTCTCRWRWNVDEGNIHIVTAYTFAVAFGKPN